MFYRNLYIMKKVGMLTSICILLSFRVNVRTLLCEEISPFEISARS